jgi:pimeloyl-ACP methyl ester carboxylesterase
MSSNPTIVIVPGSFATPNAYLDIITRLRSQSFPALEILLPSTQMRPGMEPATMLEDAGRVRAVVEALHAQGEEVVVLCHSYGGAPTTQALAGVKVKRIVYLAAEAPKVGQSIVDALAGPVIDGMMGSAVVSHLPLCLLQKIIEGDQGMITTQGLGI